MRFLSLIKVQENTGKQPSERLMREMGQLMGEMTQAGTLLDTAGLMPTAQAKRVRLRGGKTSIVDGPFTETKEVVGGYAMLKADSLDEALALTRRFVDLHVADGWEIDCELRQVIEPDFESLKPCSERC
ncbi:MAG: transcriptional regulator [Proteobacteria bacterium]|uniref:YciI family protein n=1 Tax=Rudaea sp. TaxID=2136325 RepID=UPI001D4CA4A9|nr:transcriptional regulator [Pseudomonadota bacterium]MBS0568874.1 transcriptional regulator [Pseudomonadota bacterium]